MTKKNVRIWIWLQPDNKIFKAVSNLDEGTLIIYDENDVIILRRTGLTWQQLKQIEICFSSYGAKRIDERKEPFTLL